MTSGSSRSKVDGENILYYYFKNELIGEDSEEGRLLARKFIRDLSIWLPIQLYQKIPVLFPYIIRDNSCRKKVNKKREEWGSCNSMGFFRDDNSIVKEIPKKYKIQSKNENYSGAKIGRGFVACHIWRKISDRSVLSTKNHLTNTFVPNLVWLPKQIAKLTDREGSFTQRYLQALSASVFRGAKMEPKKSKFVKNIWAKFPTTNKITISRKETKNLNFFLIDDDQVQNLVDQLLKRIEMIKNPTGNKKLHCSRYFLTFSKLPKTNKNQFTRKLDRYAKIL